MKKYKLYTLTLITCLCLSFEGCGKSNVPAITETAEIFMEAMAEADIDTISENCTKKAFRTLRLKALDPSYNVDAYFRGMGVDKELFSEEALAAVQDYGYYYADALIENYTINKVTEKYNVGYVNVTVTTYDFNTLKNLMTEQLNAKIEPLLDDYTDENLDELSAIYLEEGEMAMTIQMFDDLMGDIMNIIKEMIDTTETEEVTFVLTIRKIDGEWLVTDAYEID